MQPYARHISKRVTPQTEPIPGSNQQENNAGGYSYTLDPWKQLDRFLILGCEGGSYYVSERKMTIDNANCVSACISLDIHRLVDRIMEVSEQGLAVKNDPAIFALAMCVADIRSRSAALVVMPRVCRIGTHLLQFVSMLQEIGKWNRSTRRAISKWYISQGSEKLARQIIKYQNRAGVTHKDVLRLAHPKAMAGPIKSVLGYIAGKENVGELPEIITAHEEAKKAASEKEIVILIERFGLVRESIPTQHLTSPKVWDALLPGMPMTAMIRNLGNMSKVGLLTPLSSASKFICNRLGNHADLSAARIHPVSILSALKTYSRGAGIRGKGEWNVVPAVVDALNEAFYLSFEFLKRSEKNYLIGVDVSGSMSSSMAGVLSCAEGAAAMAMAIASSNANCYTHGFAGDFVDLGITPKMRLDEVLQRTQRDNFGSTDCSLPMLYATQHKLDVDAFIVITDNETWAGGVHPVQALREYGDGNAKLIVVGMTATNFTIADPSNPNMLDVVGFDPTVPAAISSFVGE